MSSVKMYAQTRWYSVLLGGAEYTVEERWDSNTDSCAYIVYEEGHEVFDNELINDVLDTIAEYEEELRAYGRD